MKNALVRPIARSGYLRAFAQLFAALALLLAPAAADASHTSFLIRTKGHLSPANAPSAPVLANWTVASSNADPSADGVNDGKIDVTIIALPASGGAPISDVKYRLNGGAWTSCGCTASFQLTGLTNATSYDVEIRAVNSIGDGNGSDLKTVTPYVKGGGWTRNGDTSFLSGKTIETLTTNFGAACNGSTDDRTAILAGLTWVKGANNRALHIPTGTCVYSGELNSYTGLSAARTGTVVYGDGPTLSLLKSTDNAGGTVVNGTGNRVILQGLTGALLRDFQLYAPNNTARAGGTAGQAPHGYGINLVGCNSCTVQNVWIFGVASGHLMCTAGCIGTTVRYSKVGAGGYYAGADGFHFTGANTANNVAEYDIADGVGDDSFASIGYGVNTSTGNTFRYNIAKNSTGGAGYSFEGANAGRAYGNVADHTYGPCVRIASKGATIKSGAVNDVQVTFNTFTACNQGAVADAGAMSLTASYSTVANVVLANNAIASPADSKGVWTSGTSGTNSTSGTLMTIGVAANDNAMTGTVATPFTTGTAVTLTTSGNTLNGVAVP